MLSSQSHVVQRGFVDLKRFAEPELGQKLRRIFRRCCRRSRHWCGRGEETLRCLLTVMHCCYLLTPEFDRAGTRTYIGYTVDPGRRIRQHNGELTLGAKRTRWHRPWRFVCVVMGLPSRFSGLSLEWAWQNPLKGRHTKTQMAPFASVRGMGPRYGVRRKLLELKLMLSSCKPFSEMPLHVCFQRREEWLFFEQIDKVPAVPRHVVVEAREIVEVFKDLKASIGAQTITTASLSSQSSLRASSVSNLQACNSSSTSFEKNNENCQVAIIVCALCEGNFTHGRPAMLHQSCGLVAHPVCLAREFLFEDRERLKPLTGNCPLCEEELGWAEMVRQSVIVKVQETAGEETAADVADLAS